MSRQAIEEQLERLRETLRDLEAERNNFSPDSDDYEEQFDEYLDELVPKFFGHPPSSVLKEVDPVQYSEEFSNYVDTLDVEDDEGYQNLVEEIESLEEEIELAEESLEELEDEDED